MDEAIDFINARYAQLGGVKMLFLTLASDHPLALYVFSSNSAFKSKGDSRDILTSDD